MKSLAILFVLTSHAVIGQTGEPTGLWMEELTTPYYAFVDEGITVDIVSIAGGPVPIDPRSVQEDEKKNPASVRRFMQDDEAMGKIRSTPPLSADIDLEKYDAVFLPGGHGTMFDLPANTALARIVGQAYQNGKIVAAVCHGPAGLVSATDAQGQPIVKGKRLTAFTNSEEDAVGLTDSMPFLLETRLRELGALFVAEADFTAHAVRDGRLVTGQNPASSEEAARLVLQALREINAAPDGP